MKFFALKAHCAHVTPNKIHLTIPLLMMVVLYWLSSIPGTPLPDDPAAYALFYWISPSLQNMLHIPAYAALAGSWHWALGAWTPRLGLRATSAFFLTTSYGVFDEWHQSFVPGRYASGTDVLLDIAGAALGIGLAVWAGCYLARRVASFEARDSSTHKR